MFSRPVALAMLLGLATALLYVPAVGYEFVAYDDDYCITNVVPIREGLSPAGVAWAFTSVQCANWYPLTRLSWMGDAQLFGMNPSAFHATNVALHIAAALAFFFAFVRLTGAPFRSFLVAAIFALHPLHVESVAWVASRKDVLSGLFAALVLFSYAPYARGEGNRALVAFWLACGLLAKPTLVVWPFVLLLLDFWPLSRFQHEGRFALSRLRPLFIEKLPLFGLVIGMSVVTLWAQAGSDTVRSLDDFPLGVRLGNSLSSLAAYTADAFAPLDLTVFYPYPVQGTSGMSALAGAALLLGGFVAAAIGMHRAPFLATGWLWFVGALVPVIGIIQVGQAARADRYTYLPLLGLSLAVVWGGHSLLRSETMRKLASGAALLALVGLAVLARGQLETWRNSETLFRHALSVTKRNHVAHINLGLTLAKQGELEEASSHLVAAQRLVPQSPIANGVLAQIRQKQGRHVDAVRLYQRALVLEPESTRWQKGLREAQASRSAL